ncbi:MAG: hypothetical protein KY453_05450 [Gemmatimonadetes bacterium]|nr:hypothetical protein [Gemmatimonadota bacterium]
MSGEPGRGLTRQEFDAVIRRASELAARETETSEGALSEAEVYRIAREVGLPEQHVRRALADVRSGSLLPAPTTPMDRLFGPSTLRAARVVPGTPVELARTLDEFLVAGQLLQPVRRSPRMLQYRPAVDWASQVARAASATSKRYYVASARSVEVRLEPVEEGRSLVELEVDPGTRGDQVAGALAGGGAAGIGGGIGVGVAVATIAPVALAVVAGVVVAGIAGAGVTGMVARSHRNKLVQVRAEMEGVLDRLELGESLEPPPPSWRRWVQRHFHGARRLLDDDTGDGDAFVPGDR